MHEIETWLHKNEKFPHAIRRLNIFDIFCLSLYTTRQAFLFRIIKVGDRTFYYVDFIPLKYSFMNLNWFIVMTI